MANETILSGHSTESDPLPVAWFDGTRRFLSPRPVAGGRCAVPGCKGISYVAIMTQTGRVQTCFHHFQVVRQTTGLRR